MMALFWEAEEPIGHGTYPPDKSSKGRAVRVQVSLTLTCISGSLLAPCSKQLLHAPAVMGLPSINPFSTIMDDIFSHCEPK